MFWPEKIDEKMDEKIDEKIDEKMDEKMDEKLILIFNDWSQILTYVGQNGIPYLGSRTKFTSSKNIFLPKRWTL